MQALCILSFALCAGCHTGDKVAYMLYTPLIPLCLPLRVLCVLCGPLPQNTSPTNPVYPEHNHHPGSTTMQRRLIITSAISIAAIAPLTHMTACESSQIRDLLNSPTAMDLLSPILKDAANNYIANLTDLAAMLADINSLQGVIAFIDQIQPTLDQLKTAYQTLENTTPEERKWLWDAFGPKLTDANTAFLNQSQTLTNNTTWSRLLKPALEQIELFKQPS